MFNFPLSVLFFSGWVFFKYIKCLWRSSNLFKQCCNVVLVIRGKANTHTSCCYTQLLLVCMTMLSGHFEECLCVCLCKCVCVCVCVCGQVCTCLQCPIHFQISHLCQLLHCENAIKPFLFLQPSFSLKLAPLPSGFLCLRFPLNEGLSAGQTFAVEHCLKF